MKRRQKNERQPSQLPTALHTRPGSHPLAAPMSKAKKVTTRKAARLKASTETELNNQNLDTVSSHADSIDGYDSIISKLLESDDELSSQSADNSEPDTLEQRFDKPVQHYSRNDSVDQSSVTDDQISGELRDATKARISNGEAIKEHPKSSFNTNTISQEAGPDGHTSRQVGDGTGLETEMGEASTNNRELLLYDGALHWSLHPHAQPGQGGHSLGIGTGGEGGVSQASEDDLSLSEYLKSEPTRIASKLQKLEGIILSCDERFRIMTDSQVSEESGLTTYRNNARVAKARLDMARQMEQDCSTFEGMIDSRDDTSSQQVQSLLTAASNCRKTCQAAYERTQAEMEAMETSFNARQEHLSLVEEKKRNATIKLQAWRDWQANGGKIFPSE